MLFALLVLGTAVQVSPVQKVVQLLDELKAKVEQDIANEAKLMDEYTAWCDEEANAKEDAITSSKRTIQDAAATIQDSTATVSILSRKISDLTTKISAAEAEEHKASSLREQAHGDFGGAEKELLGTVDTLERAQAVLARNLGLVQGGLVTKELSKLTDGLQQILDAGKVSSHEQNVLQSLLQASQSSEDEDLSFQPQATAAAYSSQSDGILDTIADMRDKAEGSLSGLRKDEMAAAHAHAMLKQGLEDEIAVMKQQLSEASQTKSATEEELHAAEQEHGETTKTLQSDDTYLAELKSSCAAKSSEWSERQKSAKEETEAIVQAREVLANGVKSFLQTSVRVRRVSAHSIPSSMRSSVAQKLRALGKQFHNVQLVQLGNHAESDPFGKVRGLIESMIAKLMKAAAAEADQKAFCDEEKAKSLKSQGTLNQKLDKVSVRIEKAEAGNAKLREQIQELEAEVAEIDSGSAEALQIRQAEHEEFLVAAKEYKDSATAVARAITVLDEYYSGSKAFIQAPSFGGSKGDVSSTIVGLLEVAESDFTRLFSEATAEEESATNAYEELVQESKVTKTSKQADIKGKKAEINAIETALLNYKEDHSTLSDELAAVVAYLDRLKPQCETKVMSYSQKKANREQEIEGLREALETLTSESLIQTKASLRGAA